MIDDRSAIAQLLQESKLGARHVFLHYLYFPKKHGATGAAAELRSLGFRTEERLGADGTNWLVIARHEVVPSDEMISTARQVMENLTRNCNGEYDGWEAEVQNRGPQ